MLDVGYLVVVLRSLCGVLCYSFVVARSLFVGRWFVFGGLRYLFSVISCVGCYWLFCVCCPLIFVLCYFCWVCCLLLLLVVSGVVFVICCFCFSWLVFVVCFV